MSATMTVDAAAMRVAIPAVTALLNTLDSAIAGLGGIDVPAGVPPAIGARVRHTVAAAERELRAAARRLDGIPDELLRRVSAAQFAESPALQAAGFSLPLLTFYAKSFSIPELTGAGAAGTAFGGLFRQMRAGGGPLTWDAFRAEYARLGAATKGAGAAGKLGALSRGAGRALVGVDAAVTGYSNLRNPYLTGTQKVTRTAASVAADAAVAGGAGAMGSAAAAAMFGTAAGGPAGAVIAFGAVMAWDFADSKLHISDKVGDAAADAVDAVGDAAGSVVKGAGAKAKGAIEGAGDLLGL
ncbi:hypothetical protein OHA72_23210 [Dactylosporangium sp. NBC_01737]|uniref:hypothetical protein n=1 Tax=Dactylosporangium sp. NBC_01737 TaxID=2975959 RepID=UPI002E0D41A4|nr:hypothetical protein OHA72_23210 [Dactylosporangium sp. NBC_01737]